MVHGNNHKEYIVVQLYYRIYVMLSNCIEHINVSQCIKNIETTNYKTLFTNMKAGLCHGWNSHS